MMQEMFLKNVYIYLFKGEGHVCAMVCLKVKGQLVEVPSPKTTWLPEIELRSSRLGDNAFPLSHLASPEELFIGISKIYIFFKIYLFICVSVCPYVCMCVPAGHRDQKKAPDPLDPELQMVVNCHVSVGNRTPVLCKSNECSY